MVPASMNRIMRISRLIMPFSACGLFAGCATMQPDDPLKHTKKLVSEGHRSLYNNGAFQVPNTSIRLIPPGPSALELAMELVGIRARQSFLLSLQRARESVYIVSEGTQLTWRVGKGMHEATSQVASEIQQLSREGSTLLISRAAARGKNIIGKSWEFSKETSVDCDRFGIRLAEDAQIAGEEIQESMNRQGARIAGDSLHMSAVLARDSRARSGAAVSGGLQAFIEGYATFPSKLKDKGQAIGERLDELHFADMAKEDYVQRGRWSKQMTDLIGHTVRQYPSDVANSFKQAGKELSDYETTGVSLAALRSLRWVLQGLLWDAMVEPVGKISGASIGYVGVNSLAFPAMVLMREGTATTELAIQVGWSGARAGYDLIAPTGAAAVAGIYSMLDVAGSHLAAGAVAGGGAVTGYSEQALSHVAGVVVKGTGYAAGKTVQYIGVPLAAAGIVVGGGTIGVAAGTAEAVAGGALRVTGEVSGATAYAMGNTLAATTVATGTAASVGAAAAYGYYELNKAVIVPAGYGFGSGLVMSYGTLSHLGAHTILAASDFAYLVLSLEGPRWVVYAVKGNLGKGEDLPPGTMLNLREMQKAGEEIYALPVSDEDMKNVVNSVEHELPAVE